MPKMKNSANRAPRPRAETKTSGHTYDLAITVDGVPVGALFRDGSLLFSAPELDIQAVAARVENLLEAMVRHHGGRGA